MSERSARIFFGSAVAILALSLVYITGFTEVHETPTGNFVLIAGYAAAALASGIITALAFSLKKLYKKKESQ